VPIERVHEIAAAVEEQGAATREISRSTAQAAAGTRKAASNIAGVTDAAGESGAAAREGLETACKLSQQAEALDEELASFLRSVRAG
jgi:methyl-accepting chemotaxis protein